MTRNANNSMRKMAVTGLALIGLVLGGLGTVGCDQLSLGQMAQMVASDTGDAIRDVAVRPAADKFGDTFKIIQGIPPRR